MSHARSGRSAAPAGQSYLATVSDLVSALIFVFIITIAVFAYQLANVTEEQTSVTEELTSVTEELTAGRETRDRILQAIGSRLSDAGIRVEVLDEQGVLRLSDNAINFPSGGETPITEHHPHVGALARAIHEILPCYVASDRTGPNPGPPAAAGSESSTPAAEGGAARNWCRPSEAAAYECRQRRHPWLLETLLIEGHTDDVPVAAGRRFRDNLELSSMRAATVHRMITACEPAIEWLRNTQGHPVLSTSGYGNTRPATLVPDRFDENRRIDLRFLLEPPPGVFAQDEFEFAEEMRLRMGTGPR